MHDLHGVQSSAAFNLGDIALEMRGDDAYARQGHTARTLIREGDLRIVLVVMSAGAIMKEHSVAETASVHALTGHVRLRLPDRVAELPCGGLLVLERGLKHNVEAVDASSLLLTLGWSQVVR